MQAKTKWRLWFAASFGGFAALEIPAIIRGRREPGSPDGTLTYQLRGVLGTRPGDLRRRRWGFGAAWLAFCAWLAGHAVFGLWNLPRRRESRSSK